MKSAALILDTNVWHEFAMGECPEHRSSDLILWALTHEIRLGIAAHSAKDLFGLIERDIKRGNDADRKIDEEHSGPAARAVAWGVLDRILEQAEIVGSDYIDALLASKYRGLHDYYEDNLVVAACHRMKADALVTNDQKLLKHAPVLAMTPNGALQWLQVELG